MERPRWPIVLTAEAERWFMGLSYEDAHRMAATFDRLEDLGPDLGRPLVDRVKASRHHKMKELRPPGQVRNVRALFAFDERRRALVLVGGDKTNDWKGWYKRHIPLADKLYERHRRALGEEVGWRAMDPRAGARSAGAER